MDTLGFDIGGTDVKAGRMGPNGEVREETRFSTPVDQPPEELVSQIANAVRKLGSSLPVGVACAGIIRARDGFVAASPNLPQLRGFPLRSALEQELSRAVAVLNDANAFVLAEVRTGAGRGFHDVIGLTIGTGVGGGIVLQGKLHTGRSGYGGELGHVILDASGRLCACGNRGCLEALVCRAAILEEYAAQGGRNAADPETVAHRAAAGESAAIRTWDAIGARLGLGLGSLANIFDPELFIVGGGISKANELLLKPARVTLEDAALAPTDQLPEVRVAELSNAAGWIGAAAQAREIE